MLFPYWHYRRRGTFGLGRAVTFLPKKNYTMPECVSVEIWIRTQIAVKTKTFTIFTPNETVITPKPRILYDLDQKRTKIRNL